jgi:hypothetical protein
MGDSKFRGKRKGRGGHPFLDEKVGGVPLFSAEEKENICHLEHFLALLGHRRHRNAKKIAQTGCLGLFWGFQSMSGPGGKSKKWNPSITQHREKSSYIVAVPLSGTSQAFLKHI